MKICEGAKFEIEAANYARNGRRYLYDRELESGRIRRSDAVISETAVFSTLENDVLLSDMVDAIRYHDIPENMAGLQEIIASLDEVAKQIASGIGASWAVERVFRSSLSNPLSAFLQDEKLKQNANDVRKLLETSRKYLRHGELAAYEVEVLRINRKLLKRPLEALCEAKLLAVDCARKTLQGEVIRLTYLRALRRLELAVDAVTEYPLVTANQKVLKTCVLNAAYAYRGWKSTEDFGGNLYTLDDQELEWFFEGLEYVREPEEMLAYLPEVFAWEKNQIDALEASIAGYLVGGQRVMRATCAIKAELERCSVVKSVRIDSAEMRGRMTQCVMAVRVEDDAEISVCVSGADDYSKLECCVARRYPDELSDEQQRAADAVFSCVNFFSREKNMSAPCWKNG